MKRFHISLPGPECTGQCGTAAPGWVASAQARAPVPHDSSPPLSVLLLTARRCPPAPPKGSNWITPGPLRRVGRFEPPAPVRSGSDFGAKDSDARSRFRRGRPGACPPLRPDATGWQEAGDGVVGLARPATLACHLRRSPRNAVIGSATADGTQRRKYDAPLYALGYRTPSRGGGKDGGQAHRTTGDCPGSWVLTLIDTKFGWALNRERRK